MNKQIIKRIILEKQAEIPQYKLINRHISLDHNANYVLVGLRRAGKSYTLYQDIQNKIQSGQCVAEDILYVNFEDERISGILASELGLILDSFKELYPNKTPIIYIDEIQNITGWEKFARRLADSGYQTRITGSNAKMLSGEIATTLGGRYIPKDIFPFNFREYLAWHEISLPDNWEYKSDICSKVAHMFDEYFNIGGISETYNKADKREFLNAMYQKILMGDIVERNKIRNSRVFRLLARKLADSVMQPMSLTRIHHIIKSSGDNISIPILKDYLEYMHQSYLTIEIPNLISPITDQETVKKRYFSDNGLLNLFIMDGEAKLLENLVAINLGRLYHNTDEENRLYYYNRNIEIDFCVPEVSLAIQVSYNIDASDTLIRETESLRKFLNLFPQYNGIIITRDHEEEITLDEKTIQIVPIWKWLLREKNGKHPAAI
jgi:predicted AAA+ superfamily ATPase